MHVDDAIRERRSLKEFDPAPVAVEVLRELLDLAVQAPNHHRTEPWRFVVLGPRSLEQLAVAADAPKLRRSAQAIVAVQRVAPDAATAEEDYAAIAAALQNLMLAARARGLATIWCTPAALGSTALRDLVDLRDDERAVGVVHVGRPRDGRFPGPSARSAGASTTVLP